MRGNLERSSIAPKVKAKKRKGKRKKRRKK
jgi:hypothetical protein